MNVDDSIVPFMLIAILAAFIFVFFLIIIIIVFTKRQNGKEKEFLKLLIKDRERRNQRVNLELNQNIINPLGAAHFLFNEIKNNTSNNDQEEIKNAFGYLTLALDHIYHLDQCLNDYEIEKYGLFFALSEEINWIHKTTDIQCELQTGGDRLGFPLFESLLLLRIIQEALRNSLYHADTKKINIIFQYQNGSLQLSVQDFGIGFNTALLQEQSGQGLHYIKQFSAQLKGKLDIISNAVDGTKIQLHIPKITRLP